MRTLMIVAADTRPSYRLALTPMLSEAGWEVQMGEYRVATGQPKAAKSTARRGRSAKEACREARDVASRGKP